MTALRTEDAKGVAASTAALKRRAVLASSVGRVYDMGRLASRGGNQRSAFRFHPRWRWSQLRWQGHVCRKQGGSNPHRSINRPSVGRVARGNIGLTLRRRSYQPSGGRDLPPGRCSLWPHGQGGLLPRPYHMGRAPSPPRFWRIND